MFYHKVPSPSTSDLYIDIEPFYQPIVSYQYDNSCNIERSEIIGMEVLAREKNNMYRQSAALIDSIAKDTTSLNNLTYILLRKSLDFFSCQELIKQRGTQIYLSVNVSPLQICSFSFVDVIAEYSLAFSNLCNISLVLEVTEGEDMTDIEGLQRALTELHAQGVKLYLDDYGKYYCTPYAISIIRPSCIKIDRYFINHMPCCEIALKFIEQTIEMAKLIGACVIAEGVENKIQAKRLHQLGIELMQGYAFFYPVGREHVRSIFIKANSSE